MMLIKQNIPLTERWNGKYNITILHQLQKIRIWNNDRISW